MSKVTLIQTIAEDGRIAIEDFEVGNVPSLITPSIFAGVKTRTDLKALTDYEWIHQYGVYDQIRGLYFPLEYFDYIRSKAQVRELYPLNNRFIGLIPSTEMFYHDDPKFEKIRSKHYSNPILNKFYNNNEFKNKFRGSSQRRNPIPFIDWLNSEKKDYIRLIAYTLDSQRQYAHFLVPPAPPIFNSDISLDLCLEINELSRKYEMVTDQPVACFLNFRSDSFQNISESRVIREKIGLFLKLKNPEVVIIKVFDEDQLILNERRRGLVIILREIINFCKENNKLFMVIDSVYVGYLALFIGSAIQGIPLNHYTSVLSPRGGNKQTRNEDNWKIWHRIQKKFIKWADFKEFVENNNAIPYSANLNNHFTPNDINNLKRDKLWNFRRLIFAESFNSDCSELHQAIRFGTTKTIEGRLSRSEGMSDWANIFL